MHRLRLSTLAALIAVSAPVAAEEDWLLCPPIPPQPTVDVEAPDAPGVTRAAGETVQSQGPTTVLRGDAAVRREARTLGADRIRLHRERRRAEAVGNVFVREDGLLIEGERGEVNLDTGAFSLEKTKYRASALHAQGTARRIGRNDQGISRFDEATYSTCPRDDEDWRLSADEIELNPNTRQGTARDATLWFKGVPLFYTPWFRFPIGDERMSGLLVPSFGSSTTSGFTFGLPYYWNAAPNFDATLEPRYLSDRGGQLRSEWRWLGPLGYWQLNNEYLPNDDRFGDDRMLTNLQHHARFGDGWRTAIDAESVSDDAYFEDLSSSLDLSSQRQLRRRADLRWSGSPGNLLARYETFQTLDGSQPYDQVPQLTFDGEQRVGGLETRYSAELINFERDDSDTGTRFNLRPSVGWPVEAPGWFLRPRLGWDYTAYDLNRVNSTGPTTPDRSLPVVSLDSGLIFERFGEAYRQTLEPRAFYVYTPEEEQDELPVFDTGEYGFSFSQLFRERRFTGPDRMADANRLTLALTTRLLDRSQGREVLRASVGSIYYFDDRDVQLPGQPVETHRRSDIAAEIAVQPTEAWRSGLDLRWNPRIEELEDGSFDLRYDGGENRVFNFGYRYTRDAASQAGKEAVDLSFAWPVSPRWLAVGSTRYSLFQERNFETLLGAEYESCCYKVRALARRYASGQGQANGFVIELVLKGLGGVGDDAGSLLDRAILGYSR